MKNTNTNEIENILQDMDERSRREDFIAPCVLKGYTDRLKVAVCKMQNTTGNAAAMREALKSIIDVCYNEESMKATMKIYSIAKNALAAPPRNCDRFSIAEDSFKEFKHETGKHIAIEYIKWLFAEAKGGADE